MTEPRKCPNCAALVKTTDMRFCGFCGTEVPGAREPPPLGPWGDLEARFDALDDHFSKKPRRRREPSDTRVVASYGGTALFGIAFAAFAVFFLVNVSFKGSGVLFTLIPVAFVIGGLVIAIRASTGAVKVHRSPIRRVPALVVGERTEVSGGAGDSSTTTTYHVTLQSKSGRREEYEVSGKVVGELTPGDMGLAYMKAGHLLEFERATV